MTVWDDLRKHRKATADRPILELFENDNRAPGFSVDLAGLLFDYSKTSIDETARDLLVTLAE
ncbi:MAG: glucose-6-phosphate isomerase, partial [Rhodobacteraceae bacterium]|nr:glucose-6-phosphate isomerase [Paracoccaceae bacterium]